MVSNLENRRRSEHHQCHQETVIGDYIRRSEEISQRYVKMNKYTQFLLLLCTFKTYFFLYDRIFFNIFLAIVLERDALQLISVFCFCLVYVIAAAAVFWIIILSCVKKIERKRLHERTNALKVHIQWVVFFITLKAWSPSSKMSDTKFWVKQLKWFSYELQKCA